MRYHLKNVHEKALLKKVIKKLQKSIQKNCFM